jgi:hypothetical protein
MGNNDATPIRKVDLASWQPTNAEAGELLAMTELPHDVEDLRKLGLLVTYELNNLIKGRLSTEDLATWSQIGVDWPEPQKSRIWGVVDNLIIEQAANFGTKILESQIVRSRLHQWYLVVEPHGLERLMRFCESIKLGARVIRGKGQLPATEPELPSNKQIAMSELRRLFKQCRRVMNPRKIAPSNPEIVEWIRETIEDSPRLFPFLSTRMPGFFRFVAEDDTPQRIALGDVNPGQFFYEWGAWSRNLSPVTFQQSIYNLSSLKSKL